MSTEIAEIRQLLKELVISQEISKRDWESRSKELDARFKDTDEKFKDTDEKKGERSI